MTRTVKHEIADGKISLHIEIDQTVGFPVCRCSMPSDYPCYDKLSLMDDGMILLERVSKYYSSQEVHHKWINWDYFVNSLASCSEADFEFHKQLSIRNWPERVEKYQRVSEDYKPGFITN